MPPHPQSSQSLLSLLPSSPKAQSPVPLTQAAETLGSESPALSVLLPPQKEKMCFSTGGVCLEYRHTHNGNPYIPHSNSNTHETHSHMHVNPHTHTETHTCIHTHINPHIHACTCKPLHIYKLTYMHM